MTPADKTLIVCMPGPAKRRSTLDVTPLPRFWCARSVDGSRATFQHSVWLYSMAVAS